MENTYSRSNTTQKRRQNKKYSRLVAKMIQGNVKRRILEIKRRGEPAASDLMNMLTAKLADELKERSADRSTSRSYQIKEPACHNLTDNSTKISAESAVPKTTTDTNEDSLMPNHNRTVYDEIAATVAEGIALADKLKHTPDNGFTVGEMFMRMLNVDRAKWTHLFCELAQKYSSDAISCFGTNLIYGGFMTETAGNCQRISFIDIRTPVSPDKLNKLREALRKDLSLDRRVCVIKGDGLFTPEMLRIYRYFAETAFIAVDISKNNPSIKLSEQGITNVMLVTPSINNDNCFGTLAGIISISELSPQPRDTASHTVREGKSGVRLTYGGSYPFSEQSSRLFSFLSSPSLPLRLSFDEFYTLICELEGLLSGGQNRAPSYLIL